MSDVPLHFSNRPPLRPLQNVLTGMSPSKNMAKPPLQPPSSSAHVGTVPGPRSSLRRQSAIEPMIDDKNAKARTARPSISKKRVSFSGTEVNYVYTPQVPPKTSEDPPTKALKRSSHSSPNSSQIPSGPQKLPSPRSNDKPYRFRALDDSDNEEDEDVNEDRQSPVLRSPRYTSSPLEKFSPLPSFRDSADMLEMRRSFGIFADEDAKLDVSIDEIEENQADTTLNLTNWNMSSRRRASVTTDSDITQDMMGLPELLNLDEDDDAHPSHPYGDEKRERSPRWNSTLETESPVQKPKEDVAPHMTLPRCTMKTVDVDRRQPSDVQSSHEEFLVPHYSANDNDIEDSCITLPPLEKHTLQEIQQAAGTEDHHSAGHRRQSSTSYFSPDLNALIDRDEEDSNNSRDIKTNIDDQHKSKTPRKLFDSTQDEEDDTLHWPNSLPPLPDHIERNRSDLGKEDMEGELNVSVVPSQDVERVHELQAAETSHGNASSKGETGRKMKSANRLCPAPSSRKVSLAPFPGSDVNTDIPDSNENQQNEDIRSQSDLKPLQHPSKNGIEKEDKSNVERVSSKKSVSKVDLVKEDVNQDGSDNGTQALRDNVTNAAAVDEIEPNTQAEDSPSGIGVPHPEIVTKAVQSPASKDAKISRTSTEGTSAGSSTRHPSGVSDQPVSQERTSQSHDEQDFPSPRLQSGLAHESNVSSVPHKDSQDTTGPKSTSKRDKIASQNDSFPRVDNEIAFSPAPSSCSLSFVPSAGNEDSMMATADGRNSVDASVEFDGESPKKEREGNMREDSGSNMVTAQMIGKENRIVHNKNTSEDEREDGQFSLPVNDVLPVNEAPVVVSQKISAEKEIRTESQCAEAQSGRFQSGTGVSHPQRISETPQTLIASAENFSKTVDVSRQGTQQGTPRSPAGLFLPRIPEERPSVLKHKMGWELSMSATRSDHGFGSALKATKKVPIKSFTYANFLQGMRACGMNLELRLGSNRNGSLPPPEPGFRHFDLSSTEGQILDGIRKRAILRVLQDRIHDLRASLEQERHAVKVTEIELEESQPNIFKTMCNVDLLDKNEKTKYGLNLKRLRKICTLRAHRGWVESRQKWEQEIVDQLRGLELGLRDDCGALTRVSSSLEATAQSARIRLTDDLHGEASDDDEDAIIARRTVVHELSSLRDLRGYITSQAEEERELKASNERLKARKETLGKELKPLKRFADADSASKLRKLFVEQRELNMIVSGVSGISLLHMTPPRLDVRLASCLDVQFSLHADRVINVSCRSPRASPTQAGYWQNYLSVICAIAISTSNLRKVKTLKEIPPVLFAASEFLTRSRFALEEAEAYAGGNVAEIISADVCSQEADANTVQVSVQASLFSLKRKTKFDLHVSQTTAVEVGSLRAVVQNVKVTKIERVIGDHPSDKIICDTFRKGSQKHGKMLSLQSGLQELWRHLDDNVMENEVIKDKNFEFYSKP